MLAFAILTLLIISDARADTFKQVADRARKAIRQGDVTGTCHGCAKARLRGLIRRLVVIRFRPAGSGAVQTALCVVRGESGFNPGAISHTGDYSVFQINKSTWYGTYDWKRILDPGYNVNVGWAMSKHGTYWWPWVVYANGNCR